MLLDGGCLVHHARVGSNPNPSPSPSSAACPCVLVDAERPQNGEIPTAPQLDSAPMSAHEHDALIEEIIIWLTKSSGLLAGKVKLADLLALSQTCRLLRRSITEAPATFWQACCSGQSSAPPACTATTHCLACRQLWSTTSTMRTGCASRLAARLTDRSRCWVHGERACARGRWRPAAARSQACHHWWCPGSHTWTAWLSCDQASSLRAPSSCTSLPSPARQHA